MLDSKENMSQTTLKKNILKLGPWEPWLERPFYAFMLSLFAEGMAKKRYKKIGIKAQYLANIFENGRFYQSKSVHTKLANQLKKYLEQGGSVKKISASCEKFYQTQKKSILKLANSNKAPLIKLRQVVDIIGTAMAYLWLAHGLEDVFEEKLRQEVPKFFAGDIDKIIGDLSFPKKKNMHARLEHALKSNQNLTTIQKQYGWIKSRDGFSDIFSLEEIKQQQLKLKKQKSAKHHYIKIPQGLKPLADEAQELVYYRTFRTDVLYHLLYLARPIITEVAKLYNIPFKDLANYSVFDLLAKKPKYHSALGSAIMYNGQIAFLPKPLVKITKTKTAEIKGSIAFPGKVIGPAKIVTTVNEINKVKEGDILIAQMTFPSFIMAMQKAKAFVTDEGGLTCHAAIVAREMHKPCITGTKVATKTFKDNDIIEVDANNGTIKKLS